MYTHSQSHTHTHTHTAASIMTTFYQAQVKYKGMGTEFKLEELVAIEIKIPAAYRAFQWPPSPPHSIRHHIQHSLSEDVTNSWHFSFS